MKTALIALSLLVAAGAYAQTDPSDGCEQPRSTIRPYASVDEAMAAADRELEIHRPDHGMAA